jgi:hypothetical protein
VVYRPGDPKPHLLPDVLTQAAVLEAVEAPR